MSKTATWKVWEIPGFLAAAAKDTAVALYDEARAAAAFVTWASMEMTAIGLEVSADLAFSAALVAAALARGAATAAALADRVAAAAAKAAQELSAFAAQEAALASRYQSEALYLAGAYALQQARKAKAAALAAARALKKAAAATGRALKKAGHIAAAVGKVAYKLSGIQTMVSCVTDPSVAGCVEAGLALAADAVAVGTGGLGAVAEGAAEGVVESAAEGVGEEAVEEATTEVASEAAGVAAKAGEGEGGTKLNGVLQLGIGAASGGFDNAMEARGAHEQGWRFWGTVMVGAATGAMSNVGLGKYATSRVASAALGFGAGFANSMGSQMIGDIGKGKIVNPAWAAVDGVFGAGENLAGFAVTSKLGEDDPGTMGNVLSAAIGVGPSWFCAVADQSRHSGWDC